MKKKKYSLSRIIRLIIAIIITAVALTVFAYVLRNFLYGQAAKMDDGWSVSYNGDSFSDVDLYRFRFHDRIHRGDIVTLTNMFPKTIGTNTNLAFEGSMSSVVVTINGKVSYSYAIGNGNPATLPGNAIHIVTLPEEAAGKSCVVQLHAGIDGAFDVLPVFYLIPARYSSACYTSMHALSALAAFALFTIGIIMIAAAVVLFFVRRDFILVFMLGVMAFSIGTWTLCTSHVIEFFSSDYLLNTLTGIVSMYLALIPMTVIVVLVRNPGKNVIQKIASAGGVILSVAFIVYTICAYQFGGVYPVYMSELFQIVAIVSMFLVIAGTESGYRKEKTTERKIIDFSVYALYAFGIIDYIRYHLKNRVIVGNRMMYASILPLAAIMLIVCLLVSYMVHLRDHYMKQAKEQVIKKLALTDVLTGLANRAYFRESLEKIQAAEKHVPYHIISMDVNGLKKVNDTYGHAAGDQLIRDCAKILTQAFAQTGKVIRMGGDEFVILIKNGKEKDIKHALTRMEKLEAAYELKRKYAIRISYGVASSDEKENMTYEAVYNTADERMYVMKKETNYVR